MTERPFVIITAVEVRAQNTPLSALEYAALKFKVIHNININPDDLNDQEMFSFLESNDGDAFKIVYNGFATP